MSERMTIKNIKASVNPDSSWANTIESVNCSSLIRIANSLEVVSQRHTELIRERDYYYEQYKKQVEKREALQRKVAALRGVITKLKAKSQGGAQ